MVLESIDHGKDVMMTKTLLEMDVKNFPCYCKKQIDNNIFHFYAHISSIQKTSKFQNFAVKSLSYGSWFYLIVSFADVISMVDNRRELRNISVDLLNECRRSCQ